MNEHAASAKTPYPFFAVARRDMHDARLLQDAYGGRESETTAILQYAYQSYVLERSDPELSGLLKRIAIAEMKHHELLGEAIWLNGKSPLIASNTCFWSGSAVDYSEDPVNMLEKDIADEKQAIKNYERIAAMLHNPSCSALVLRIVEDEKVHVKLLTEALEKLTAR